MTVARFKCTKCHSCKFYHSEKKDTLITGLKYKSEPSQAGVTSTQTGAGRKPEFEIHVLMALAVAHAKPPSGCRGASDDVITIYQTYCLPVFIAWLQAGVTFIPPSVHFLLLKHEENLLYLQSLLHRAHIWRFNSVSTCEICAEIYQKHIVTMIVSAFYIKEIVYIKF